MPVPANLARVTSIGEERPLRVLFVSSTTMGGSGRSQRELDTLLQNAGVETMMLVDNAEGSTFTRFLHEQLWDASIKFRDTPVLGESATWLRSIPGRRASAAGFEDGSDNVLLSTAPENALGNIAIVFRPDIVVGSSIARTTWRSIQETCSTLHIPTALYLREETALGHLVPHAGHPFRKDDLLLANSRSLVSGAESIGHTAHFVPSAVDLRAARTEPTRERVLLVNPRREHGVDLIEELARSFRTTEFVLQESWKLSVKERHHVDAILSRHPNVMFRERTESPADVFRDAAILLAPHQMDNRPRTILEAQSNAIPVIASDLPGLSESVGPGGILVAHPNDWLTAVRQMWQHPPTYRKYQELALRHSKRNEIKPDTIVTDFLTHVQRAVRARGHQPIDLTE